MEQRTAERIKARRFDRMRLGQAVATYVPLLSDPEITVAMVPLTEAEHYQCLQIITGMEAPDTIVGAALRDRRNALEVLLRALREKDDLQITMFQSVDEMTEVLGPEDINYLQDNYFEMMEDISPSAGALSEEEIDDLKKVLGEVSWSELSGRQWYALRRFLSTLGYTLLPDNLLGSSLTSNLITTSGDEKFISTVSPSGNETPVKSVESQ